MLTQRSRFCAMKPTNLRLSSGRAGRIKGPALVCQLRRLTSADAHCGGDDGLMRLICPTCQKSSQRRSKYPCRRRPCYFAWVVFDILVGSRPLDVAAPREAQRAKRGGPGRTRTCNQTVMSGRLSIAFVDFTGFPVGFVCVRRVSVRPFLVRNWSGAEEGGLKRRTMLASL